MGFGLEIFLVKFEKLVDKAVRLYIISKYNFLF